MLRTITSAIVMLLIFSACQKGDTGPAGATGATGATGAQGPTGSAYVIYSQWFAPNAYVKDTLFYIYHFDYTDATADITQAVADSGLVIVFAKLDGYVAQFWPTNQVGQLPITLSYKTSSGGVTYNDYWTASITAGYLKIDFYDDQNLYNSISSAHQFRYVIIPGGKKSTVDAVTPGVYTANGRQLDTGAVNDIIRNYQQMSYAQVCQRLGIPE